MVTKKPSKLDSKPIKKLNNILEPIYISKFHVVSATSLGAFNSSAKLTDATIWKTKLKVRPSVRTKKMIKYILRRGSQPN